MRLRQEGGPLGRYSVSTCEYGQDDMARVREELVLQLVDEEDREVSHCPWRYWHPSGEAGVPF